MATPSILTPILPVGYTCDNGEADICVRVSRNVTPGDDIYYPASPSYKAENSDNPIQDRYPSRGTISYSLGGDDADKFDIDPSNGDLLPKGRHAYEDKSTYSITITATDKAGRKASVTLNVERSGSANSPAVIGPMVIRYPENGTWRLAQYTGFNIKNGKSVETRGWIIGVEPGGGDGDFFDIDDDGVLRFVQPPDYEDPADENGDREYSFTIMAYDTNPPNGERPGQTFYRVRVIVYNVEEDLEILGPTSVKYPENSITPVATYTAEYAEGTLEWMLSMDDDNNFSINNNGELTFNSAPDYESFEIDDEEHIFLLSISVTDGADTEKIEPVRVEVTNVNEAPEFPAETATITISEDTLSGTEIGEPILADDPDDGDLPRYDLSGADAPSFTIGYYSGQLQTAEALDFNNKQSYTVIVTATDRDGLTDNITVAIGITDVDYPPAFADATAIRTVDENTPANENIGAPVTADDPGHHHADLHAGRNGQRFLRHRKHLWPNQNQSRSRPRDQGHLLGNRQGFRRHHGRHHRCNHHRQRPQRGPDV